MARATAELELEVARALQSVDRIEAALRRTAQGFSVQLGQALDQLTGRDVRVDATVDVDDSQLRLLDDEQIAVTAAVDDSGVDELTSSLGQAEQAADGLEAEVREVDRATDAAGQRTDQFAGAWRRVGAVIAGIGIGRVLRETVSAASDLEESTSKVTAVFGESTDEILRFGETSATTMGLANQEALEFAGTFGNLFRAIGLTEEAAADLSPRVLTLGADLASFNNLGVDETLEKLRSGLVGEIEPLRSLGINFNAAQVEAKGLELGLADVNGELDEGAKVQARWALIAEQSSIAAGDFERTSGGLANQSRILRAELGNAAAEIGAQLLPTVLELVQRGRDELLPTLLEIGERAAPLFAAGFSAGLPILQGTLDVVVALLPVLQGIATVIDAIPDPVLRFAGTAFALSSGLSQIPRLLNAATLGTGSFGGALDRMRGSISPAAGALTGLVLVGGQVSGMFDDIRRSADAANEAFFADLPEATTFDQAIANFNAGVREFNRIDREVGDRGFLGNIVSNLQEAGQNVGNFFESFVGLDVIEPTISALEQRTHGLNDELEQQAAAIIHWDENLNIVSNSLGITRDAAQDLANRLGIDLTQTGAADALLEAADASDDLTVAADGTVRSIEELADEMDRMVDAFREWFGIQSSALELNADFEEGLDRIRQQFEDQREAAEEGALGLDTQTEAGRENLRVGLQVRDTIIEIIAQRLEETGSINAARQAGDLYILNLRNQLTQAGLTKEQVDRYIETLNLTPEDIDTALQVSGIAEAEADIAAVTRDRKIQLGLELSRQDIIDIQQQLANEGILVRPAPGTVVQMQHGGTALAGQPHIVGEVGPELFIPNVTGAVVSNDRLLEAISQLAGVGAVPSRPVLEGPLIGSLVMPAGTDPITAGIAVARQQRAALRRYGITE